MSEIRVDLAVRFVKELDRLARKFPRTLDVVAQLVVDFRNGERPGDKIPGAGQAVCKVRLRNPSVRRGKGGGFRVVYYVRVADHIILLTIYSKSAQEDISTEGIRHVLSSLPDDLIDESTDE